MKRIVGFLLIAACDSNDWARYDQLFQVDGNLSYEAGLRVCAVARGGRHVAWIAGEPCEARPGGVSFGQSPRPSTLTRLLQVPQPTAISSAFTPAQLAADDMDYLALDRSLGVAWWESDAYAGSGAPPDQDVPRLHGIFRPEAAASATFGEVAVNDGLAWLTEPMSGVSGALHRIDLNAGRADSRPLAQVIPVDAIPVAVDAWPEGAVVAFVGTFQGLRRYDLDGAQVGEVALAVPPDGVKVGGRVAWVTGERQIWAVNLDTLQIIDEAGTPTVDDANVVLHAEGPMFFLASGRDAVSMVWDGERPDRPKAVGGYHVGDGTWDIDTAGQTLYLAAGSRGMQVWAPRRDWDEFYGTGDE